MDSSMSGFRVSWTQPVNRAAESTIGQYLFTVYGLNLNTAKVLPGSEVLRT